MILYHGGTDIVAQPVIKPRSGGRVCMRGVRSTPRQIPYQNTNPWVGDLGMGFYVTDICSQAEKWARRQGRIRKLPPILNMYEFDPDRAQRNLNCKLFVDYSTEWLELVINCRKDIRYLHGYDIVYGKIANDGHSTEPRSGEGSPLDVGETVQAVVDGLMPLDFALQKLVFMPSNNQYCFCSQQSLAYLGFIESRELG